MGGGISEEVEAIDCEGGRDFGRAGTLNVSFFSARFGPAGPFGVEVRLFVVVPVADFSVSAESLVSFVVETRGLSCRDGLESTSIKSLSSVVVSVATTSSAREKEGHQEERYFSISQCHIHNPI